MSSAGLRIRDLSLPLTKHKRSLIDGSIEPEAEKSENELYFEMRKFLVQCRFVTPIRGVSAVSVPTTDRTPIREIKKKLLEQLHDLPEQHRPPDSVLAAHGSRYYQRKTLQNDFKVSITTDPNQLIFFIDEQDEALSDSATFFDLGFESSPPLVSVYCATDHVWLRLRGCPERYSIPWHLHMTECELAKEVYGILKPRDMRMVRGVFYKDEEALKMHRKYRRPATEAPPVWKQGSHFGKYETEDNTSTSSSLLTNVGNNKKNSSNVISIGNKRKSSSMSSSSVSSAPLQPIVIPLHEWCQIPPPPNTKIDPALIFEEVRREAAQIRSEMIREALMQARDSWFEVPSDVEALAQTSGALEHIPKWIHVTRMRDGRNFCFKAEVLITSSSPTRNNNSSPTKLSSSLNNDESMMRRETNIPIGDLAEAVLSYCTNATNKTGVSQQELQRQEENDEIGGYGGNDSVMNRKNKSDHDDHHHDNSSGRRRSSASVVEERDPWADANDDAAFLDGDDDDDNQSRRNNHHHNQMQSFETELLSWIPHLVSTGNILKNGEEERVPHAHPQLFLPFDDDDEEVSPFGCKEIHTLWDSRAMVKKYPFLEQDFFFHKRRAKASVEQMEELMRKEAIEFLNEPLQFAFNPPYRGTGTTKSRYEAENPPVEFDNASLPRHLSDYGIFNGAEIYIEHFSIHSQSWSNEIAQEVHDSMKTRAASQNILMSSSSSAGSTSAIAASSPWSVSTTFDLAPDIMIGDVQTEDNKDDDDEDSSSNKYVSKTTGSSSSALAGVQFSSVTSTTTSKRNPKVNNKQTTNLLDDEIKQRDYMSKLRQKKAKQLQLSKRQREETVKAAGFNFVNVRSARGTLFRVPVIFESAIVQDILDLMFCATGDIPMFSIVVGPQGDLLAPWAPLKEMEKNPGLLTLRILRRPRAWLQESVETVARDASRLAPHLDY